MDHSEIDQVAHALLGEIRKELGDLTLEYRSPPTALHGGKFSSVFAFELTRAPAGWSGQLVLRLVGTDSEQARLEAGLHDAALMGGVAAPRVLLWGPAGAGLGEAFIVMERLSGRAYLRGVEPLGFALDFPKVLSSWPERFEAVLDTLGLVDATDAARALERHGVPDRLARPGRHLDWAAAVLAEEVGFREVMGWLRDNRPAPEHVALVHGDLWPANVFIRDGGVGLVDWTRGAIDDPALDVGFAKVGFALMPEPFPPPAPIRQLVGGLGKSVAQRMSARCDERVGGRDRVRYYEALRCAVELAGVVSSRRLGAASGWEHGVPALVRHLEGITDQRVSFA